MKRKGIRLTIPRDDRTGTPLDMNGYSQDDPALSTNTELDGISVYQDETVLPPRLPLLSEIRTGSEFPYLCSEKDCLKEYGYDGVTAIMLLDESRVVTLLVSPVPAP